MSANQSLLIEFVETCFQFITTNIWPLAFIVLIVVLREALSEFVKRIINFTFKQGTTEVGLAACAPEKLMEPEKSKATLVAVENKEGSSGIRQIEEKKGEDDWFSIVYIALENGEVEKAKSAFKEYYVNEKDEIRKMENEAFFQYLLYSKSGERDSVQKLIALSEKAVDESGKLSALQWASKCYKDSNNYDADIKLWQRTCPILKENINITKCISNYSSSLSDSNRGEEALRLLRERLRQAKNDEEFIVIYKAMSIAEKSLGNNMMAALCKEKALEFIPDDNELLFDTAYAEGESDLKALSLCNYSTLTRIDQKNATAFNNLGVCASEFKIDTKAYDFYMVSKGLGDTLSAANLGYKLLEVGCHGHALNLAKEAQEKEDVHENVYSLITKISEYRQKEAAKWTELMKNAASFQLEIRKYIPRYYDEADNADKIFSGTWYMASGAEIVVEVQEGLIKSKWNYTSGIVDKDKYEATIQGRCKNKTAQLRYQTKKEGDQSYLSLLMGIENKDIECYSYVHNQCSDWYIFSKNIEFLFELKLSRKKHWKRID